MKTFFWVICVIASVGFMGCQERFLTPEVVAPLPPSGLSTESGDGFVKLFWNASSDPGVVEYRIYVSSSYNGTYERIGSASDPWFIDWGARNGATYYYEIGRASL